VLQGNFAQGWLWGKNNSPQITRINTDETGILAGCRQDAGLQFADLGGGD